MTGRLPAVVAATTAAAAAAVVYVATVGSARARSAELDARFAGFWRNDLADAAGEAALAVIVPLAVAVMAWAALRLTGRATRRAAVAAGAAFAVANLVTQAAKVVLERVDPVGGEPLRETAGAFPSGHATIGTAALLAALMLAAPRARPLVAVCLGVVVAAGNLALLTQGWHYPGDIVAGALIAFAVAALAAPERVSWAGVAALWVALAVTAALLAAMVAADGRLAGWPAEAPAAVGAILAVTAGVALAFTGSRGAPVRDRAARGGPRPVHASRGAHRAGGGSLDPMPDVRDTAR